MIVWLNGDIEPRSPQHHRLTRDPRPGNIHPQRCKITLHDTKGNGEFGSFGGLSREFEVDRFHVELEGLEFDLSCPYCHVQRFGVEAHHVPADGVL